MSNTNINPQDLAKMFETKALQKERNTNGMAVWMSNASLNIRKQLAVELFGNDKTHMLELMQFNNNWYLRKNENGNIKLTRQDARKGVYISKSAIILDNLHQFVDKHIELQNIGQGIVAIKEVVEE